MASIVVTLGVVTLGCGAPRAGDGGGDASSSDVSSPIEELAPIDVSAPTKRVVDLSTSEQILLCNWNAREFGGYGGSIPCLDDSGNPGLGAPVSLQDCVDVYRFSHWGRDCPLTVEDFMACVAWQVANVCNVYLLPPPPECTTQGGPQCEGAIGADASNSDNAETSAPDSADAPSGDDADAAPTLDGAAIDGAAIDGATSDGGGAGAE